MFPLLSKRMTQSFGETRTSLTIPLPSTLLTMPIVLFQRADRCLNPVLPPFPGPRQHQTRNPTARSTPVSTRTTPSSLLGDANHRPSRPSSCGRTWIHGGKVRPAPPLSTPRLGLWRLVARLSFPIADTHTTLVSFSTVLFRHLDEEVADLGKENMLKFWTIEEVRRLPI